MDRTITDHNMLFYWFELECIGFDNYERLVRIIGNTCDDIEHAVIVKFSSCPSKIYLRHDMSNHSFISEINYLDIDRAFDDHTIVLDLLSKYGIDVVEIRREMSYYFDRKPSINTSDVVWRGDTQSFYDEASILSGNKVISRAWSVRRNMNSAEIAVETDEKHRRKNLAKRVVSSWVSHQIDNGKVPIYSHRSGNVESQKLVTSCGGIKFAEVISYH
jgi:GNAT acetyltransferase-like protein